jgi:hypothetical protein
MANGDGLNLTTLARLVPWAIVAVVVGVIALMGIGAVNMLSAEMPWETKVEADNTNQQLARTAGLLDKLTDKVSNLSDNQIRLAAQPNDSVELGKMRDRMDLLEGEVQATRAWQSAEDARRLAREARGVR